MGKLLYDLIVVSAKWLAAVKEQLWLVGQAVKTSPSHGENRGSIPLRAVDCLKQPNPIKRCKYKVNGIAVFFIVPNRQLKVGEKMVQQVIINYYVSLQRIKKADTSNYPELEYQ